MGGLLIFLGISAAQFGAITESEVVLRDRNAPAFLYLDQESSDELGRFFGAKEQVFKRRWQQARTGFEAYLKEYPKGQFRDEALYWLAQSLNMLSKSAGGEGHIIRFKENAVSKLNELIQQFPKSLWWDDGMALRLDLAVELVMLGQDEYKPYLDEAVRIKGENEAAIKLQALNSLVKLPPDFTLPFFQRIIETDPDPNIRKQAVSLLGRFLSQRGEELLEKTSHSDNDPEVREEAAAWLERIHIQTIPVQLQYYVYSCRILDESLNKQYPAGKIQVTSLPPTPTSDIGSLVDRVKESLESKVSPLVKSSNGRLPFYGYFAGDRQSMIIHGTGDYRLWIRPDKLKITADQIRGEVRFWHRKTNKELNQIFRLNNEEEKVLAVRSGDRISLLILQFAEVEAKAEVPKAIETKSHDTLSGKAWQRLAQIFSTESEPVHHTKFTDLMGWEIHSSRESWSEADLTGQSGKYDFGQAEAMAKQLEGWKLIGQLVLLKSERRLIGRKAILINPEGLTAAIGDEIMVPVDRPSNFKVTGPRKIRDTDSNIPDYGELEVNGVFTLKPGVKVNTAREYFNVEEFDKPLINFEQSKAELRENDPYRPWILLGDVFWLKNQKRLIGFGAILVNPDREIKAQGLISIPLSDPAAFQVLRGRTWTKKQLLLSQNERRTRYFYPCLNSNVQGWEVLTTRHDTPSFSHAKIDFSRAQATRSHNGKDWILVGQIILMQRQRHFIARQAALINSAGEIVFGTEIQVSTDNPADHKVIKR